MTDTDTYDVEFSPNEVCPADPSPTDSARTAQGWYDPVRNADLPEGVSWEDMKWRAERECKNGSWGSWVKVRIKGETGDDAEYYTVEVNNSPSISVKKSETGNGSQYAPGQAVFKVMHIKGGAKVAVSSMPDGFYMKLYRSAADGTSGVSGKITSASYSSVTGSLFYFGQYDYVRMDLYDGNDKLLSSADVSLAVDGTTMFKSTAFIRLPNVVTSVAVPTGGTWDNPVPTSTVKVESTTYSWSDGIPEGDLTLWATTRLFYKDGTIKAWSTPRKMTDTATFDVEFAKMQTNDATPATPTTANRHGGSGTQIWFDPDLDKDTQDFTKMYWRAERECKNGQWGSWVITRIKGEKGGVGNDAPYYLYKYQWNGSPSTPPDVATTSLNPGNGWSNAQPQQTGVLTYLWRIFARVSGDGTELLQNWSTPVRVTPSTIGQKIQVRGTAYDGTTQAVPHIIIDGSLATGTYARGLTLSVRKVSDCTEVFHQTYDTYSDTSTSFAYCKQLINKLKSYENADYIIILFSYDAIGINSGLYTELMKFGCSFAYSVVARRSPFAFIGRFGLRKGQATHAFSWRDSAVDITASVINGELMCNGAEGGVGVNLVNNSEYAETFTVQPSGDNNATDGQFIVTTKALTSIPIRQTISGQARITLSGCAFNDGGGKVLVYFGSNRQWPTVGELTGITANGTYDIKCEGTEIAYNDNETWNNKIHLRLNNFKYNGGGSTITIERVKVEVGLCTDYSVSPADLRGPAVVFRGEYDASKTYYGTNLRVDCVRYNSIYYVARADAGGFNAKTPTDTAYWNEFGGQFDSVATQLLIAEYANIAGWIFKDNQLISQLGLLNGAASEEYSDSGFIPNIALDGVNGELMAGNTLQLNRRGLMMYNGSKLCAKMVNETINIDTGATSGSSTINTSVSTTLYLHTATKWYTNTALIQYGVNLGVLTQGSKITLQNATLSTTFPTNVQGCNLGYTKNTVEVLLYAAGKYSTIIQETITSSSGASVAKTLTFNKTIEIDGTTYKEGYYSIYYRITGSYISDGAGSAGGSNPYTMQVKNAYYSYQKALETVLLIGNNGLFNRQSDTNYLASTRNDGFVVRYGKYMLRVCSSGIQKSTDSGATWTTL